MQEKLLTRADDGLGEGLFDSVAWVMEKIGLKDSGCYQSAVMHCVNEDSPQQVDFYHLTIPNVNDTPAYSWIAMMGEEPDEDGNYSINRERIAAFGSSRDASVRTMPHAYFILAKAQIVRETRRGLDKRLGAGYDDYSSYLKSREMEVVKAIDTWEKLDGYLMDSKRMSLREWLASLSFEHTQD